MEIIISTEPIADKTSPYIILFLYPQRLIKSFFLKDENRYSINAPKKYAP